MRIKNLFRIVIFLLMWSAIVALMFSACCNEQPTTASASATIENLKAYETEKAIWVSKQEEAPEAVVKHYYDVPLSYELQDYIALLCEEHHIDSSVVVAMIQRESQFTAEAIGDGGDSLGLMQIQPKWHQARMDKLGCPDLLDPYQNVTVGIDLLAELADQYGAMYKALVAYNTGSYAGTITEYASTIMNNSEILKEGMIEVEYIPDAYDMWEAHDAEQQRWLEKRPVCADCGEHIQDERAYYINGDWICAECISSYEREVDQE